MSALNDLHARFADRAQFFVVYVREAHAADSRSPDPTTSINEPRTSDEREDVARTCATRLSLRLPMLIDGMDGAAERAYDAWPDRIYVVDREGKIHYRGGHGPFGFDPRALERVLEQLVPANQTEDDDGRR